MSRFASNVSSRPRTLATLAAVGALTTAALLVSPTVASAAEPDSSAPEATVRYSFSELATDQGTRAVYQRITRAAESVCPTYDERDLEAESATKECERQAEARAVSHIGNAHLAAVYTHAHARHG
jgi:UrcA family protein